MNPLILARLSEDRPSSLDRFLPGTSSPGRPHKHDVHQAIVGLPLPQLLRLLIHERLRFLLLLRRATSIRVRLTILALALGLRLLERILGGNLVGFGFFEAFGEVREEVLVSLVGAGEVFLEFEAFGVLKVDDEAAWNDKLNNTAGMENKNSRSGVGLDTSLQQLHGIFSLASVARIGVRHEPMSTVSKCDNYVNARRTNHISGKNLTLINAFLYAPMIRCTNTSLSFSSTSNGFVSSHFK